MRDDQKALDLEREAWWNEITAYVADEGTDEERAATRARLGNDPAFSAFAAPVFALWALPIDGRLGRVPKGDEPSPGRVTTAMARLERSLTALQEQEAPRRTHDTVAWGRVRAMVDSTPSRRRAPRGFPGASFSWQRMAWAGIALVAALPFVILLEKWVIHPIRSYHGGGMGAVVALSDGSRVELAPGAYLGEDRAFGRGGERTVYLFGQARFHVRHDPARPFQVQVIGARAKALGTTFTVARDTMPKVRVIVAEGKVSLDVLGDNGAYQSVSVITADEVESIPIVFNKMMAAATILSRAGVPVADSRKMYDALLRGMAALERQRQEARQRQEMRQR